MVYFWYMLSKLLDEYFFLFRGFTHILNEKQFDAIKIGGA